MFFGNRSFSSGNNGKNNAKSVLRRRLGFESLENRELLSVTAGDFSQIKLQHEDLNLTNYADYNVIEITANQLSAKTLRDAVTTAGTTVGNDLIVIRNDSDTVLDFGNSSLKIDIDPLAFGSVTIVAVGEDKLQIQSGAETGVLQVNQGDVALGGIVLVGVKGAAAEAVSVFDLIQARSDANVQTSQVIQVSENANRPGNFTIPGVDDTELLATSGGSQIGTKSYSVTVNVGGTLEAYLTGLSEAEKNYILANAGSLNFVNSLEPFDAEKNGDGDLDHCWAGSSSNMLAYTGWGNVNGFQTEDDIFQYFRENFTDNAGNASYGNEWFFTGNYAPTGWSGWAQLTNDDQGAFYPDIVFRTVSGREDVSSSDGLISALAHLENGTALGISLGWYNTSFVRQGGHAITMWGGVYDTSKELSDPNRFVSIFISDPDDNKFLGENAPNKLQNLSLQWVSARDSYRFNTYSGGTGYLEGFTWLMAYTDTPPEAKADLRPMNYWDSWTKPLIVTNYTVAGYSDKSLADDSPVLSSSDSIYLHFAVTNHGAIDAPNAFTNTLTITGGNLTSPITKTFDYPAGLSPDYYRYNYDINIGTLAAGEYTVTLTVDSANTVDEYNENDNTYVKTFTVGAGSTLAVPEYSSLPGANHTIYLDFNGHITTGTSWNSRYGSSIITTPAFDLDGNPNNFSTAELEAIYAIYATVAEYYAPFHVNVTTVEPSADALTKSGAGDTTWGIRVAVGGSSYDWLENDIIPLDNVDFEVDYISPSPDSPERLVAGIAYLTSFNYASDTPAFAFSQGVYEEFFSGNKYDPYLYSQSIAKTIVHEVGHTLNLQHDGNRNTGDDYYRGHRLESSLKYWAPVMGSIYVNVPPFVQWSMDTYPYANNSENDLNIITTQNGFGYRTDETTTRLVFSGGQTSANGLIQTSNDSDDYTFTLSEAGNVSFTAKAGVTVFGQQASGLYFKLEIHDAKGEVVASQVASIDTLSATMATNLEAGDYTLRITGTGYANPLSNGFASYGSLGSYAITGTTAAVVDTDIGDTLDTAETIVLTGNAYIITEEIGNGKHGNKDVDIFKLVVGDGDVGSIFTFGTSLPTGIGASEGVDTCLRLFDDEGNQIGFGNDDLTFTPTAAGTYYLGVSGYENILYDPMVAGSGSAGDTGSYTLTVSQSGAVNPPTAPANFRSTEQMSDSVTLAWDAQEGLTHYELAYKKSTDSNWVTWTPAPGTSATDATITGLESDTTYNFRLTATNADGSASSTTDARTLTTTIGSLTPAEYAAIRSQYADLNLSANMGHYNIIVIDADELSDVVLRDAIATAGVTTSNDLIVVRTTESLNKVTLTDSMLAIDIDASTKGTVDIVSFGDLPLTIDASQVWCGLSITKGTVGIGGLTISNSDAGIYIYNAAATVTNCTISDNGGRGIYASSDNGSVLIVTGCTISRNGGSGVYSFGYTTVIANCSITENSNPQYQGGGVFVRGGTATVVNSTISGNTATTSGGGIYADGDSFVTLINSSITGNTAGTQGGGIHNACSVMTITNCTIAGNTATTQGGGIYNSHPLTINNSIVAGNFVIGNTMTSNVDIYRASTLTGSNNLIGNGTGCGLLNGVNGNIVGTTAAPIDPQFVDAVNGDYRITAGSAAINKGNNALAKDASGNTLQYDLDGNARIIGSAVDMGAYEYQTIVVDPPTAPANFRSTAQTHNSVTLAWDTQKDLAEYVLQYKKSDDAEWTTWMPAPGTSATSATITGLEASTAYNFQLTAVNDSGSESSATDATTVIAPPTTPVNFRSTAQTTNSVTLVWNAQDDLTGYTLLYKKSADSNWSTWTPAPGKLTTTATITGLETNTEYDFQLTATNASGSASATTSATTTKGLLTTPSLTIGAVTADSVTLSWTTVPNATGYIVERSVNGGSTWTIVAQMSGSYHKNTTATGLLANTKYQFRVMAVAPGYNNSAYSAVKNATTTKATLATPALTIGATTETSVALSWAMIPNATSYEIQGSTDGTNWTMFSVTGTSTTINDLTGSTTYHFRIKAIGSDFKDSEYSTTKPATTKSPLAAPTLNVGTVTTNSVVLSWAAIPNATSYIIQQSTDGTNWDVSTVTGTSATIGDLTEGMTYQFRIQAAAVGYNESAFSAVKSVATTSIAQLDTPTLTIDTATTNSVALSWTAIPSATSYVIERSIDGTNWTSFGATGTSTTAGGLSASTVYQFRIKAIGSGYRESEYSDVESVTTPPAAPVNFTATERTTNSITLSWNAQDNLTGYTLQYKKTTDANWTTWEPPGSIATGATVTDLEADTAYNFRLTATNVSGSASSTTSATTLDTAPLNLRVVSTSQTTLSIDWNDANGASGYVLQRKGPGETEFKAIYSGVESKYTDRGLTAGTDYEYRVQVVGSAAFSDVLSVFTAPAKVDGQDVADSPMILDAGYDATNNRNTITWTNLGDDYVYTVYKSGRVVVDGGTEAFYTDSSPTASGTDGYTILAYHTKLKQYSTIVTAVLHSTAPAVEITGVEFLDNGSVKLLWDAQPGMYFAIMQAGRTVSGADYISSGEWIDENPDDSKEYILVTFYPDSTGGSQVTFSNLFSAKRPVQNTFAAYDAFWSEYGMLEESELFV